MCDAFIKLFGIGVQFYFTAEPYGKDSLKLLVIRVDVCISDAVRFQSLREACFMLELLLKDFADDGKAGRLKQHNLTSGE